MSSFSDIALGVAGIAVVAVIMNFLDCRFAKREPTPNSQPAPRVPSAPSNEQMIQEFGAFMERNPSAPTRITDATVLPHRKELILDALFAELNEAHSIQLLEYMKVGAYFLADFQHNIGPTPLEMLGIDINKFTPTRDVHKLREQMRLQQEAQARTCDQYREFSKLVEEDRQFIRTKISAIEAKRRLLQ